MTVEELLSKCDLCVATHEMLTKREPFLCENDDLNDFFAHDATIYQQRLLGKTYFFCLKENPCVIVSAFTLSNDSIRITNKLNETHKEQFLEATRTFRKEPSPLSCCSHWSPWHE